MANLLGTMYTKFYLNRSGFVDYIKKHLGVFLFGSQCGWSMSLAGVIEAPTEEVAINVVNRGT